MLSYVHPSIVCLSIRLSQAGTITIIGTLRSPEATEAFVMVVIIVYFSFVSARAF